MSRPLFSFLLCLLLLISLLGATPADRGEALRDAAGQNDATAVRTLLAAGVDPDAANDYGATALSYAADKGHLEVVKLLVEAGASLDARDTFYSTSPIEWAAYNGHLEVVRYLLGKGADPDSVLQMAIFRDHADLVEAILAERELPAETLSSALSAARRAEKPEIVSLLEKAGAKPPEASTFQIDPAALAAFTGTYALETQGLDGKLEIEEGVLVAQFPGNPPIPLEALDETTFRPAGGTDFTIRFQLEEERIAGFELAQEGRDPMRFVRRSVDETAESATAAAEAGASADTSAGSAAETSTRSAAETPADATAGTSAGSSSGKSVETPRTIRPPEAAARTHWPGFRGPGAAGTAQGPLPTTWNVETGENLRWKTAIPGRAHSSPVVWGDRLFVTTAVNEAGDKPFRHGLYGDVDSAGNRAKHSWRAYALDKKTGEILWHHVAHEGSPRSDNHIKATQANATPVTDGKRLIAVLGSEGLFAYDLDGELLWQRDLGTLDVGWFYDPSYEWGHASSPILFEDLVIVQVDRNREAFLAAYRLADGELAWQTPRDNLPSWGTPTLVRDKNRVELVTNGSKLIRGYDPRTGAELWRLGPNSEVTVGTPVTGHGLVFVVGGYPPIKPIYAIRPGGKGDLTLPEDTEKSPYVAWKKDRGGTYMPTPIVYGDYLYTNANNGVLTCYDARTGEEIYKERISGRGGDAYTASPVAGDGKLYLTSEDGDVYVVRAGPEFERLAKNPIGEVILATPAISDGMIFIRSLAHLYGIGEPEGETEGP